MSTSPSPSRRRNLVMVRAGEASLHRNWLARNPSRTWDLVVSWYGDGVYEPVADETVIRIKGGKGDGTFRTFAELPELAERYDHVWLPDDDLDARGEDIDRLFAITAEQGLDVAQPALTADSYFTHPHTLVSPSFLLRYTTLVEVMAACMTAERLRAVLPLMEHNPSTFGIDLIWARLEPEVRNRGAIVDAVTVRHTRPTGRFLRSRLEKGGNDPERDYDTTLARYGLVREKRFWCYAGLARDGHTFRGPLATRAWMARDVLGNMPHTVQPKAWRSMLRQFKRPIPDLSQVRPVAG